MTIDLGWWVGFYYSQIVWDEKEDERGWQRITPLRYSGNFFTGWAVNGLGELLYRMGCQRIRGTSLEVV